MHLRANFDAARAAKEIIVRLGAEVKLIICQAHFSSLTYKLPPETKLLYLHLHRAHCLC